MLVEQLMKKNVTTIKPYATLKEALQLMKEKNLKSLVVEKNSPSDAYGLITNTQILKAIVAEDGDIELLNVYDLYKKCIRETEWNFIYFCEWVKNKGYKII